MTNCLFQALTNLCRLHNIGEPLFELCKGTDGRYSAKVSSLNIICSITFIISNVPKFSSNLKKFILYIVSINLLPT